MLHIHLISVALRIYILQTASSSLDEAYLVYLLYHVFLDRNTCMHNGRMNSQTRPHPVTPQYATPEICIFVRSTSFKTPVSHSMAGVRSMHVALSETRWLSFTRCFRLKGVSALPPYPQQTEHCEIRYNKFPFPSSFSHRTLNGVWSLPDSSSPALSPQRSLKQ